MAEGILGTGVSGLLASQRALSTASNNIANVNTEGYSRQRVELVPNPPQASGFGFIGSGVTISGIERIYDESLTLQVRNSTSGYNQLNEFHTLASQVDNLLADSNAGLMQSLQSFFNAVHDVANDPSSTPARQVLLSEAATLEDRFGYLDQRLNDIRNGINTQIKNTVTDINALTSAIADMNRQISNALTTGAGKPNDLLDRRDVLIGKLAEKLSVTTVTQQDGTVNVFTGSGQALVAGLDARSLTPIQNVYDPEKMDIGYVLGSNTLNITDQLTGGSLGGMLDFRSRILDSAQNALGHLAVGLTETLNAQHRAGMDLNGNLGGDFFKPLGSTAPEVLAHRNNTGSPAAQIDVSVTDANALTTSDYVLERNGASYTLTRLSDNTDFTLTSFPGGSETIDGLTFSLASGSIADGDRFLVRPSRDGAVGFGLAITNPAQVAAAVPVRTGSSLGNTGESTISSGSVVDNSAYDGDSYTIRMVDSTAADADGVIGTINDNIGTDNALEYQLVINGTVVYSQNEAAATLPDKTALAAAINDDVATTGIRAYVDTTNDVLYLANEPQTSLPINVTEQIVDSNAPSLALDATDTITGYFGSSLTGASPSNSITYNGAADSYLVIDSSSNVEAGGSYVPGSAITFNGIQVAIDGQANLGDSFDIDPNSGGVSDNRNALSLANMQTQLTLNRNTTSFEGAYSQLVVDVGSKTRQADINSEAQLGLLNQAIDAREAKSGVNLDEEAADMIRFQQAYQASARVIATADTLFKTLIDAVGG